MCWELCEWESFLSGKKIIESIRVIDDDEGEWQSIDGIEGIAELVLAQKSMFSRKKEAIKVAYITCYVVTEELIDSLSDLNLNYFIYESDIGFTSAAKEHCNNGMTPEEFLAWLDK